MMKREKVSQTGSRGEYQDGGPSSREVAIGNAGGNSSDVTSLSSKVDRDCIVCPSTHFVGPKKGID